MYVLKLYDEELLRFDMKNEGIVGLVVTVHSYDSDKTGLLPLGLRPEDESLAKWLRKRVIPKNRAFVHQILKQFGLDVNDTKGILDVCMGLSLNDSYWVVRVPFKGRFKDYNLYENPFSRALSLVAYTGFGSTNRPFTTSPELTTDGMLRKSWRRTFGGIYLWKGGSEGAANAGMEPYSEFYAAQVAAQMGLDHVEYALHQWKGAICSVCPLFTSINTAYVPVGRIVTEGGLPAVLRYYRSISEQAYQQIASMLVFDALIYNDDRHFGNFGVLRNSRTGEVLGAAPVFDNGLSLFNFAMDAELDDLQAYADGRFSAFGVSHDEVAREVMGPPQKAQLRRLLDFAFKGQASPQYAWSQKRRRCIQAFLSHRVRALLELG